MNNRISKKKLLEKAYYVLLEKLNVKKICISFYGGNQFSKHKYRCVPNLRAVDHRNAHIHFEQKDSFHGFNYVYIRSLNKSTPRSFAPWEIAQCIFKLLEDISIYIETENLERKCVLPKGLSLEQLLINYELEKTSN